MTAATAGGNSTDRLAWRRVVLLLAVGMGIALTETLVPSIIGLVVPVLDAARLAVGYLIIRLAVEVADQSWRLPWRRPGFTIVLAFVGCLVTGCLGDVSWPNSGDEYSYVFLADTFRAGRLWDPAPPDLALFQNFHVLVKDGRTFSPYPPAWSAWLVPFRALSLTWLANPVLTVAFGIALDGACRRLELSTIVRKPALALVLLTPFALFMGGSLFPQTMACALVACIVWAQLADEARPRAGRKLLIGMLFGILLLTRYDVFAIVALVYGIDRIVWRRLATIGDGLFVTLGVLPFVVCLAGYNAAITGSPLQLTADWASPDPFGAALGPALLLERSVVFNVHWLGDLAQFGGLPVLLLAAIALVTKMRRRTCRFYDFLLPAAMVFYSFMPFTGDHQYGPRYWFWAWPLSILTITSGLVDAAGDFHIFGRRMTLEGFASAFLLCAAAAFCVLLVTTHAYIEARRVVFDGPQPASPAVVLVPDRSIRLWPWQRVEILASSLDFTRNDLNYTGRVLYGRSNIPDAVSRACRLDGREVFRWEEPTRLVQEVCP